MTALPLKPLLKLHRIKQEAFAAELFVTRQTVSNWCRFGIPDFQISKVMAGLKRLGVDRVGAQ